MAKKEVIQLRCSTEEKNKWRDAANAMNLELSAWIRLTLDRSLRNQPTTPPLFREEFHDSA